MNKINKLNIPYAVKGNTELNVKDVDLNKRIVTGFFNTFNVLDSDMDLIVPGAAKKSIAERGAGSDAVAKIKHALFHDLTLLPGKIQVLEEKKISNVKGIYFETKMSNTSIGNDTLVNYQEGVYDNHSIGFQYVKIDKVEAGTDDFKRYSDQVVNQDALIGKGEFWIVKEIKLFEGSTVAFGANQLTPFLGVKSGNIEATKIKLFDRLDKIEGQLKSGIQSDDMMQTFEIQKLQIKQLINELLEQKSTPREPLNVDDKFDINEIINNFKL